MAKELTDVYKTLQRLSFHFGTTLRLPSVSYKPAAKCAGTVCPPRRKNQRVLRVFAPIVPRRRGYSVVLFRVGDRAGFTATAHKGRTENYPPPSAAVNQPSGVGRFDDKDFKGL